MIPQFEIQIYNIGPGLHSLIDRDITARPVRARIDPALLRFCRRCARRVAAPLILVLALWLFGITDARCLERDAPSEYRTASAILALSQEQANRNYPAHLRGVVTLSVEQGLVLHDATAGIWIYWEHSENFSPGDVLEVHGNVASGMFTPVLNGQSVHKVGRSPLPKPAHATFKALTSGDMDTEYVTIVGEVRSIALRDSVPRSKRLVIKLRIDGGFIVATLPIDGHSAPYGLIDSVVRITGTAMCSKNDSRQIISPTIALPDLKSIRVLRSPPGDPFSTVLLPIEKLMQYRSGTSSDHRVRVAGRVTYYRPGQNLIIEDRGAALDVRTTQVANLSLGDVVEVAGFPTSRESGPILEDALVRRIAPGPPLEPTVIRLSDLCSGKLNNNLVAAEGRLLRQMWEPSRQVLLLQNNSSILLAELASSKSVEGLNRIPEGSTVRISGISALDIDGAWNYGVDSAAAVHCKILLRTPTDVRMIKPPTWWTTRHVVYIALALALLALAFLVQIVRTLVERWKLEAVFAERERLAHDMHDTLAQSFAGIGFQLRAIRRSIPGDLAQLREQVDLAQSLVRHSHKEARRSIEPLRLEPEEAVDVIRALEQSARQMVDGGSVEIAISIIGNPRPLPAHIGVALFRIGQEAIANAIRHADPTHLNISMNHDGDRVTLSVEDDGVGFVKSGDLLGFGLRGMRRRSADISAEFEIVSNPGNGTCVTVSVPLPPPFRLAKFLRSFWSRVSERLSHANANR